MLHSKYQSNHIPYQGQTPTNVFHCEPSAWLENRLCGLYRPRRKWRISPHHWRLYRWRDDMGCRHWWTCLLHLDVAVHVRRFTWRCPALHRPWHGSWAGHLWNVVLHGLWRLVVGLEWAAHGWPGTRRAVCSLPWPWPLSFMVYSLLGWHHLFGTIHAVISWALCRSSKGSLPVWIVGVAHLASILPHTSLGAIRSWLHGGAHHLRWHGSLGVGACARLHAIPSKRERELVLWSRRPPFGSRVRAAELVVHFWLSRWRSIRRSLRLLLWLLTTKWPAIHLTIMMALCWRVASLSRSFVVLFEGKQNESTNWVKGTGGIFKMCFWSFYAVLYMSWYAPKN